MRSSTAYAGQELRKRDLAAEFERIEKTIKRDLSLLKSRVRAVALGAGNNVVWVSVGAARRRRVDWS